MLKIKESWKQNLVLLAFCALLVEVLSGVTLLFVVTGVVLVFLGKRPNKYVRNFFALVIFASYWFKYGKIIDPEIGLNFLTSIIVLKILEKDTVRDHYMIFFGLLLLISAGSLFERTLTYVLFFGVSFSVLIYDFYSYLGQKWKLKNLGLSFIWILPLTFFLFFFAPRFLNPIPFQQNTMAPGEIGYTPDVNISQIESLEPNQSPVFQVAVNRELYQSELYWRGNTLSFNDGWNWKEMLQDKEAAAVIRETLPEGSETEQTFRIFIKPDYFFALDYPRLINYGERSYFLSGGTRTLPQKKWAWVQRYKVLSHPEKIILDKEVSHKYLQLPLSRKEKEFLKETFPGKNLDEVGQSIRTYFDKEKFSYSLSPGRIESLGAFLEKKTGLCSHYASATALILRAHGVPTRLVSGFMGGHFNKFADFYLVSQNDAHVWVEALREGRWIRLDPTEWIAPDRVRLGGEAFIQSVDQGVFRRSGLRMPAFFQEWKLWFQQWDFLFYQWLEEMDYHAQESWFSKIKFKRKWLFTVIPLLILVFMLIYILILNHHNQSDSFSPHQKLWSLFYKKMEKRGIILSRTSIGESEKVLMLEKSFETEIKSVWEDLLSLSFKNSSRSVQELMKRIKKL